MNKLEEMLEKEKSKMNELLIPDELEGRLRHALEGKPTVKKTKRSWSLKVAVLVIALLLAVYNMDTLAFYGRELLGFDNIMNGTLKELNKTGMGQAIEKSHTFSNGATVTLNGVMLDDNQLLAFYTVKTLDGRADSLNFHDDRMKGVIGTHHIQSAQGEYSKDERMIKWIAAYEPPFAIEKSLDWTFSIMTDGKVEQGKISFVLDRDKAMGHTLKTRLNETIGVDGTNIKFSEISASPTMTLINGSFKSIIELAMDKMSGEQIFSPMLDIELLANGKAVDQQGSGVSSDLKGFTFEVKYDALPKDLKTLQLHLTGFTAIHEVDERIKLDKSTVGQAVKLKDGEIIIEKVIETEGETFVTITSEDTTSLMKVYLLADDNSVELAETIDSQYKKEPDGAIMHTRTLRFKAAAKDLQLDINKIRYRQIYDEYVDIPID